MLPWPQMMSAALAAGVPIHAFWQLSVREWRWLADAGGATGLQAETLKKMMADFPDKDEK